MPKSRTPNMMPWWRIGSDALAMWTDASMVIGLRAVKVATGGPAAQREMKLMIAEKIRASAEVQSAAATGALGHDLATATSRTLALYAPKVRANRRRLAGGR